MVEQIKTGLTGQDEALFAATQQEKPTTRILPRQASLLRLFNNDVQGFYMLPWIKVPTLGLLRWFEGEKFTPGKPCPEVLAIAAYRAIIASGERHRWGRRVFAAHCALSDFRARKIIDEAIEDSASQMHPTRIQGSSQTHPETIPDASRNLPPASSEHPSISRQTATSEQSILDLSPTSIPDASHSHPNVNPPASKCQPASIPHARAFLDSDKRSKIVDRDLRTDKEEHGESLISMGDALVVGVPVQSSLMDALKPTKPSKPTKAPKQAKDAKPPKAPTVTESPPDISEAYKDSKLWCGIWYGTECRTKDGPNRELFDTIAEVAERFRESSGIELMMDRKAYNFVKDTISQWLEQGGTKKQLLTAAECPADDWLMKRGLWTFQNQFGSIGRIQANSGKASKPADPKVDNLGRQQDSTSFMDRLKQMYPPKKETTDAK